MNKTYRLIWNELAHTWVAVAEIVKGRGKRASGIVAHGTTIDWRLLVLKPLALALASMGIAHAAPPAPSQLPSGGQLVAGQAAINQGGATLTITQGSNRAAIDWQTFNVGSAAQVKFIQPASSSVTLNRVLDSNPSKIFGRISANGQVFLTNPNGVYFAPGASVDVGGLVATTHSISNDDFMAGNNHFTRNGATGSVINDGNLSATLGGYIALLAPEVRNNGVIVAQLGTVALAACEAYDLQFDTDNTLANIRVAPATIAALVENGNAVHAPGGLIILSARAANSLQGGVVRNSGNLEANSLTAKGGRIVLEGDDITLASGSTLDASGATGGGTVLVGGDWQGSGGLHQATTVTMAQGATVDVSATKNGAGGTAVLWSDVHNASSVTSVQGTILAKGGVEGGNGGKIETSGHYLNVDGALVQASASAGDSGEWLLDPYNVTISNTTSGNAYTPPNFSPSSADSTIQASTIQSALAGGSNVTITTGSSGASAGDITVDSSILTGAMSADATLTLNAYRDITVNKVSIDARGSGNTH
jgi:filamentous hemagglutinin family protein